MSDIFQIVIVGIIGVSLLIVVRQYRPEIALQLSIAIGIIIFLSVIGKINAIMVVLKDLAEQANINMVYMGTVLKIVGIAYIAEFGAQICRDSGEGTVAAKVEFAAKILVLVLALPIIVSILQTLIKLIP
jgi:stage III sporulation protein AD